MRARFLTASVVGCLSLLEGVTLIRFAPSAQIPAVVRGLVTVGSEIGATFLLPRRVSAATVWDTSIQSQTRAVRELVSRSVNAIALSPPELREKLASASSACPGSGMIFVEGDYCPEVQHTCKHWLEDTGRYAYYRCAEYLGAKCLSKNRVHKRFCMDRDEYVPHGEALPASHRSWTDASKVCASLGRRVCLESEWNFACEGEEMRPYPYGWKRDPDACNADRVDIYRPDGQLLDLRVGAEDKPRCVSSFGVHNLSGNLEEWTTIDSSSRTVVPRPAMKGAYWQPSRNHCRAAQIVHDRYYNGTETGFRCCADAEEASGQGFSR